MRKSTEGLSGNKTLKEDLQAAGKPLTSKQKRMLQQNELLSEPNSIVPSKPGDLPIAITRAEYDAQQKAFEYLNQALFDGTLPNVAIVYSRRAHSGGHFAPDRFTYRGGNGGHEHELSLNPDGFTGRSDEWIVSILLHEMCHLWQHIFGTKKRAKYSYHDREWASKMEELGLMSSTTGMPGGKQTGQRMSHFIIPGGVYQQTFEALAATGWKLSLQSTVFAGGTKAPSSKLKYTCPACVLNAWAKPDSGLVCRDCLLGNLDKLPWLDGRKMNDLIEMVGRSEMLLPKDDQQQDIVASYDGEVALELAAE